MDFHNTRFFRVFREAQSVEQLREQFADLRQILFSALQEIEVLKSILRENNLLSASDYERVRIQTMLEDHSSQGPSPWKSHSQYKYTLEEIEFLKEVLLLPQEEIDQFKKEAAAMETMT